MTYEITTLVYRQDKIAPTNLIMVEAAVTSSINSVEELLEELRTGVNHWARAHKDGILAYASAGDDMNIGDIGDELDYIATCYCPNIEGIKLTYIDSYCPWKYDTPLCNPVVEQETNT